jgi:hypothetical protein
MTRTFYGCDTECLRGWQCGERIAQRVSCGVLQVTGCGAAGAGARHAGTSLPPPHPPPPPLRGLDLQVAIPVRAAAAWDGGKGVGAPRATRQGQGSASANASRPLTGRTRARAQRAAVCWLAYCGRLLACGLVGAPRRPDRPRREERSRARSSYIVLLLNCGWGICKKTRTLQRSLVTALLSGRADHGLSHISCMWRCGLNVGVGFVPFLNTFWYVLQTRVTASHTHAVYSHTRRAQQKQSLRVPALLSVARSLYRSVLTASRHGASCRYHGWTRQSLCDLQAQFAKHHLRVWQSTCRARCCQVCCSGTTIDSGGISRHRRSHMFGGGAT